MKNYWKILYNGIVPSNPVFVLLLGMCATLSTTSSAYNGMMMGIATAAVLLCSNVVISLVKNLVPDKVRIPAFIVIIASFVTVLATCGKRVAAFAQCFARHIYPPDCG